MKEGEAGEALESVVDLEAAGKAAADAVSVFKCARGMLFMG